MMSSIEEEPERHVSTVFINKDNAELESDETAQMLEIQIEVSDEIVLSEEK
jgi:hypothetical protein